MKKTAVLLFLLTSIITSAQSFIESIDSKKLKAKREFTVTLPKYYDQDTNKKYPTLLILDGEYLNAPFLGNLQFGNFWDDLPEMIVIAVNQNGEQRFDDSEFDKDAGVPMGKGAAFFEFLGMELLPYVESKYRTQPFRVIAGHDTTAGFMNFYLYKDDPVFNGYISLAPEMATGMSQRVADRLAVITKPIMYYLATGEGDINDLRWPAEALNQNINAIPNKNFRYQFDDFKGASHYSLVPQAIPQALYFIFDGYQPISMVEYQEKIVTLEGGYTKYLIDRYTNLEQKLGLKVTPRLTDFRAIEAAILKNKKYDDLLELSKYAEKHYPKTTLSVYHQALYLEKTGQYKKATKMYNTGFTKSPVRELSVEFMLNKAESIRGKQDEPTQAEPVETPPASEGTEGEGETKKGE